MKYRCGRRFYNPRYNPMQSDNFLFSANKFGGRRETVVTRDITTRMFDVTLNFDELVEIMCLCLLMVLLRTCAALFNRYREVRLKKATCVLDVHGVAVTTGTASASDPPKLQVTLCKDVRNVQAGMTNFDPRAQPGAVTKLIDGGANVGGLDDVMKVAIKFPRPEVDNAIVGSAASNWIAGTTAV